MQPEIASPKKRFIESSSFYRNCELNDPFSSMRIDDSQFLDNLPTRGICSVCNRSRKYYCYTCYVPVKEISDRLPKINLPIKIDIIKHPKEVDGKSTSAHAAVLAPDDVKIYNYPDFPSYDNEKVLLIFPGKSAVPFQEWWNKAIHSQESSDRPKCSENLTDSDEVLNHKETNSFIQGNDSLPCHNDSSIQSFVKIQDKSTNLPFSKVIFIDSTWRQSKAMYNDSRLQSLPCVILSEYKSVFWRHQKGKPDTYLATIEAIYYFLRELDNLMNPGVHYSGKYDNLLFLFKYFYMKLRCIYDISSAEK
ncbi:tRNA-uridine aminocarboxypropyltransferase 1-like isoform X2 [Argiope bruennichi]|uniref:tRNA-uridine aminocarboxypropyltransferase 1-like isoform X2 n=1 Tax=Argiope bruennichi TaxID=94029 RepID=UPI00249573E7|nr:tRNA-uridine aminocarboxypropyltransferase 1-like isoform X2 [Argiope bruennichi]